MSNEFKAIESIATKSGATVLYCNYVTLSKTGQTRIVLITDCYISQYKTSSKPPELTAFWCDLEALSNSSSKSGSFVLEFSNSRVFSYQKEKNEIIEIIIELVQRILTPSESVRLGFEADELQYKPTPRGSFARFLLLNMRKDNELTQKVKESVAEYLLTGTKEIRIQSESNIENNLDIFLKSIRPLDYIDSISLPPFKKCDPLPILSRFLRRNQHIKHIELNNLKVKTHFHDFCTSIENSDQVNKQKKKGLTGITLVDCDLNEENIASIKTAAAGGRLLSLGIVNCINAKNRNTKDQNKYIDYFIDTVLQPQLTERLNILALDQNIGIDIQKLVENIGNIQKLSLQDCQLEIAYVLEALSSASLSNKNRKTFHLDSINLSGNLCTVPPDVNKADGFPQNLTRIDVNRVNWVDDGLTNFLSGFVKLSNPKGLTLSLSYTECSKSEWQNVKSFFEDNRQKPPIVQLSWNGNPISSHFVLFLKKLKSLERLFLNHCTSFERFLTHLAGFVSKSESLKELYLEKVDCSSEAMQSFIEKLTSKNNDDFPLSLKTISLRHSKIGSGGLTALYQLIEASANISEVAFDGSYCDSFTDIQKFIRKCHTNIASTSNFDSDNISKKKQRQKSPKKPRKARKLLIELPSKDLRMLKAHESDVEEMKLLLAECAQCSDDAWIPPLEFFTLQKNDAFPKFVSKTDSNGIEDNNKDDDFKETESLKRRNAVNKKKTGEKNKNSLRADDSDSETDDENDDYSRRKMKPNRENKRLSSSSDEDNDDYGLNKKIKSSHPPKRANSTNLKRKKANKHNFSDGESSKDENLMNSRNKRNANESPKLNKGKKHMYSDDDSDDSNEKPPRRQSLKDRKNKPISRRREESSEEDDKVSINRNSSKKTLLLKGRKRNLSSKKTNNKTKDDDKKEGDDESTESSSSLSRSDNEDNRGSNLPDVRKNIYDDEENSSDSAEQFPTKKKKKSSASGEKNNKNENENEKNIQNKKKKKRNFNFKKWEMPTPPVDVINDEALILRLQNDFSIRQLYSDVTDNEQL